MDWTVWSISTIAPFFIPLDWAVPTPITFRESFNTSPIITLIFDVPISRLTKTSLLFKEKAPPILNQKILIGKYQVYVKNRYPIILTDFTIKRKYICIHNNS